MVVSFAQFENKMPHPETDSKVGYVDPESEGGLEEDLATRRYRALLPEDDYDSDDD